MKNNIIVFALITLLIGTNVALPILGDNSENTNYSIACKSVESTLNIENGTLEWSFIPGYFLEFDTIDNYITTPILSDPYVKDNVVYFGAKGNVYALLATNTLVVDIRATHNIASSKNYFSHLNIYSRPPILLGDDTHTKLYGEWIIELDHGKFNKVLYIRQILFNLIPIY